MCVSPAVSRIRGSRTPGLRLPPGRGRPGRAPPGDGRITSQGARPRAQEAPVEKTVGSFAVKKGLAQMLKGGVIMDVVTAEHARLAEDAGAVAVMALERVPADIRAHGGGGRISDPAGAHR